MAEQETTITVKEIRSFNYGANKDRTGFTIFSDTGEKYSTFSTTINLLAKEGESLTIKYEVQERNGYTNNVIKDAKDAEGNWVNENKKASSSRGMGSNKQFKADPEKLELERQKNHSILKQVALKCAVELVIHKVKPYTEISDVYNDMKGILLDETD